MFYVILVIAGIVLAANRKQQAASATELSVSVAQSDTTTLPHFTEMRLPLPSIRLYPLPGGPGIGAGLGAVNSDVSNIVVVSGPSIYGPDKSGGPAGAPGAAPSGGGTSAGTTPSGTGGGGVGPTFPAGPHGFNTL